jgi:hypothetical protein
MADPLKPIDRTSLTLTDEQRYAAGGQFGMGAATRAGRGTYTPTNDLAARYNNTKGFGLGSKDAGGAKPKVSDLIDVGNTVQNEFRAFAQRGVSSFKPSALDYAAKQYKISVLKYKG